MKRKEKQLSCKSRTKNWEKFCYLCCQYRNISKYYIDYYIIILLYQNLIKFYIKEILFNNVTLYYFYINLSNIC